MANSTSTDVTFGGAWCNRVVAKQEDSHSTAPADKQINEKRYTQPPPLENGYYYGFYCINCLSNLK